MAQERFVIKRGRYIHNMTNILTKQLSNFFFLNDKEIKFIEQFYKFIEQETIKTLNNADNKYIRLGGGRSALHKCLYDISI